MRRVWIVIAILMATGCSDDGSGTTPDPSGEDMAGSGMDMQTSSDASGDTGASSDMAETDAGDMSMANCDVAPEESTEDGAAGEGTVVGALTQHATFHSFGFEWDIDGDTDHDATVRVRYRKTDACEFKEGMHLIRNDYAWYWGDTGADEPINNFAGSLMFLTPGTEYQVVLELEDPDGGTATRVVQISTRAFPVEPTGGRTLYVTPGSGGGDGSENDPYQGLEAADAAAQPGDIILVGAGTYSGTADIQASGEADNRIVWRPAGDGDIAIEELVVTGSHLWFDELTFETTASEARAIWGRGPTTNVAVTNSSFNAFEDSIYLNGEATDWIVMDNTIVGDKAEGVGLGDSGDFRGEGVEMRRSAGHIVAYNTISRVSDGISECLRNCDIYGNEVFDTSDDGIEPDYGFSNVRMWGNRIQDVAGYSLSFQPQKLGPWYFIRNQIMGAGLGVFKWRTQDRLVFINNTFISGVPKAQFLMKAVTRNNLFVRRGSGYIWTTTDESENSPRSVSPPQWEPDWRTDVDYDGFDWGDSMNAFWWRDNTERYSDIESFSAAVGIEQNGVRVDKDVIFEDLYDAGPDGFLPKEHLTLVDGTNAVDTGGVLPNLADTFEGAAPDLGALEVGRPLPHYGARAAEDMPQHELYWAHH